MKTRHKALLASTVVVALIGGTLWAGKTALESLFLQGMCSEKPKDEVASPDGRFTATEFVRSCGATTGFITHVNLRSSGAEFRPEHSGSIRDGEVFLTGEWVELDLRWLANDHLLVQGAIPRDARQDPRWQHVRISYAAAPPRPAR